MNGSDFLMPSPRSEEEELVGELVDDLNARLPLGDDMDARRAWEALVETGIHAVLLDADADGAGDLGFLAVIADGLGAGLNAETFIWGAVAVPSLLAVAARDDELAQRIAEGALPTVAMHAPDADAEHLGSTLSLSRGSRPTLSGTANWVPFGREADAVVAVATDGDDLVLVEVLSPDAVVWAALEPFDLRTPLAHGTFDQVPVRVIGSLASPLAALLPALLCQAAAITGSSRTALTDAVGYSKVREQFGVPIAHFQAVRHRLAESLVELELMRAVLRAAGRRGDRRSLLLAAYHCLSSAATVARANIQVHGGIGYTWEHSAHRHYRYAFSARQGIVSLASLERLVADELGRAEAARG